MTSVKVHPETAAEPQTWPEVDRRRPGRAESVNPELIPLLRGQIGVVGDQDVLYGDPDHLRAVRGLAVGAIVSCALWVGLVYLACLVVA